MNEEIRALFASSQPSERSLAIDRARLECDPEDRDELRNILLGEPVVSLRRRLSAVIRQLSRPQMAVTRESEGSRELEGPQFEEALVGWVRHELEPGIGWLRLAASGEIENFADSETNEAIEGLRKRIDSVEALIRTSGPPRISHVSLAEIVAVSVATSAAPPSIITVDIEDQPDDLQTDPNLLALILRNAIANAVSAVALLPESVQRVQIAAGTAGDNFWIRISNRFEGTEFSFDEVSASGVSSKIGHQGQGLSVMRRAASRLDYSISTDAQSGLAVFVLRGCRTYG